jgi:hypothetical protein
VTAEVPKARTERAYRLLWRVQRASQPPMVDWRLASCSAAAGKQARPEEDVDEVSGQRVCGKPKPGKQPGAPGSHFSWSQAPGDTVPHFPQGSCECGADLAAAADLGVAASHQVVDVQLVTATVTQHDLQKVACGCGRVCRAAAPGRRRPGDGQIIASKPFFLIAGALIGT